MSVTTANQKVLIIEDDADIRGLVNLRLRQHSYETVYATDGMTALSVARREQPDVILLDLGLPAGDGYTVMERLGSIASLAAVPVIVISARDAATNRDKSLLAGAAAFVEKPIDFDVLLRALDYVAGRNR